MSDRADRLGKYIAETPFTATPYYSTGPRGHYRVALCGRMHSGKSTAADMLVNAGYARQAFAAPVKQFAATAVNNIFYDKARLLGAEPWDEKTTEDLNKDKERYRVLFQWVGNYCRDEFGEDFWVDLYKATYPDNSGIKVVNDDLRYVNEAEFLTNRGYQIIKIHRPEVERIESIQKAYESKHGRRLKKRELKDLAKHGSEAEIDNIEYDSWVENDGTIEELRGKMRMIVGGSI